MANNEINDLTAKTTPVSTDEVEIQETAGGLSKKATVGNLAKGMSYNDLNDKPSIPTVSDTAYDATSWNGNTDAPTKNAVRDKIESMGSGDVVGPASATTGNIPSYNGTTGKLLSDSGINASTLSSQISDLYASKADSSALTSHTGNTSNPHSVTASQVGLGNVDNTSDATKNSATATLTNKTISGSNNTLTNIPIAALPITKTTDANGWTVYDTGAWKSYRKAFTVPSQTIGTGGALLTLTGNNLPTGVSTIGSLKCTYSILFAAGSPFVMSNFDGNTSNTTIKIGVARASGSTSFSGTCYVDLSE